MLDYSCGNGLISNKIAEVYKNILHCSKDVFIKERLQPFAKFFAVTYDTVQLNWSIGEKIRKEHIATRQLLAIQVIHATRFFFSRNKADD